MKYNYKVYGLHINSSLKLPFITTRSKKDADIKITVGSPKNCLDSLEKIGLGLQANTENIVLTVVGIAQYALYKGQEIIVSPAPQSDLNSVINFLIGAALPYLIVQRGSIVLRAAAFTFDGKQAHLLMGNTGSGKSTLLAKLCQQGAQFLSDQFVVLSQDKSKQWYTESGFPLIKLWKNSIKKLQLCDTELTNVRPNIQRSYWKQTNKFQAKRLPIRCIFHLMTQNLRIHNVCELQKSSKKMNKLNQWQYGQQIRHLLVDAKQRIQTTIQLANQSHMFSLTRINGYTSISDLTKIIVHELEKDVQNNMSQT